MLIGMITAVSILLAVGLCVGIKAFAGLMWLWLLPAVFLGSFLLQALLAFLFLILACAVVDPDKPREKDSKFYRTMTMLYIRSILIFARVRVETQGLEKTPRDGRFLLVCNHIHDIDPAILLHCFPHSQLAFVSKKENHDMFLVGKIMPMLLCPLINRENDREALKTILRCIQLLKEDRVSVGIFPEGYIPLDRKLRRFRPGVFKIAQKANVPIVVCTLRGSNTVIPNLLKLKSSQVHMHLLDVIQPEQFAGKTTVEIAEEVYAMMAADLGPENVLTAEEENT